MNQDDPVVVDRRNILHAAMMGGGLASLAGCAPGENQSKDDIWAGFDTRITERTLAEAEKLFGLEFSTSERQQILGGAVEEGEAGFFAKQVATLQSRRSHDIPNSLAPATSFDPNEPNTAKRITRGGSFLCSELYCTGYRPAARMKTSPDTGLSHTGFRLVAEGAPPEKK